MDRITFDFENELFIAENDEGKLEQKIPGLSKSRQRILADAGILIMDASGMGDLLRQLRDGRRAGDDLRQAAANVLRGQRGDERGQAHV